MRQTDKKYVAQAPALQNGQDVRIQRQAPKRFAPQPVPAGDVFCPLLVIKNIAAGMVIKKVMILQKDPIENAQRKCGKKDDNKRWETFLRGFPDIRDAHCRNQSCAQATAARAAVSTFSTVFPSETPMHPRARAKSYSWGVKSPSGPIRKATREGDGTALNASRIFLRSPPSDRLGIKTVVSPGKNFKADVKSATGWITGTRSRRDCLAALTATSW